MIYIYIFILYNIFIYIYTYHVYVPQKKKRDLMRIVRLKSCGGFVIVNAKPGLSERYC